MLLGIARGAFFLQAVSCTGPLKTVVIDSVSAVIHPLLGGRQSEGETLRWGPRLMAKCCGCKALPEEHRPPVRAVPGVGAGLMRVWLLLACLLQLDKVGVCSIICKASS